jgi:hypothetical protein
MQAVPIKCPVCGSEKLRPSKRQPIVERNRRKNHRDSLPNGIISYRCENAHVFVIAPRSSAAGAGEP